MNIAPTADLVGFFTHNHLEDLKRMAQKEKNLQRAAVVWKKMAWWGQGSGVRMRGLVKDQKGNRSWNNLRLQTRYTEEHHWLHSTTPPTFKVLTGHMSFHRDKSHYKIQITWPRHTVFACTTVKQGGPSCRSFSKSTWCNPMGWWHWKMWEKNQRLRSSSFVAPRRRDLGSVMKHRAAERLT